MSHQPSLASRLAGKNLRVTYANVKPLYTGASKPLLNNGIVLANRPIRQTGAVLVISLIMLLLLTLIGTTSMQATALEEKMAGNMRDKDLAFQAAESALKQAEITLDVPVGSLPNFTVAGTDGYYLTTTNDQKANITTDAFWTANPKITSSVDTTKLGNDIAPPVYIIEKLPAACFDSAGCPPNPTKDIYRITVRATGASDKTVVILQSLYTLA